MADQGSTEGDTSSPSTSTNQMLQTAPPDDSENIMCPTSMDAIRDQVFVSWCSHAFCFPCILERSHSTAVCPICQKPFQYLLCKVGDNNYEVYSIGHYIRFARPNRGRRAHHCSAGRRQHRSTGCRQRSSSSRDLSTGSASAREREQSRSRRQHHSGHSRGQQAQSCNSLSRSRQQQSWAEDTSTDTSSDEDQDAQSYNILSSSRQQQSWARDTSTDTSSDENQDARFEQDAPVRLRRSEWYQQGRRVSSRELWATRS